ncbi:hypothetical protein C0Q70_17564 [Pomacea canaliculata]|uniref:Uncharacterized protein n=1 Tax=Pomacea canaliculata TaxID=400727 RepID=A0A2T7NKR7_POMCA|nr:hypothetical protein C0Q70_17564 [Pomacea canaliculata]
MRGKPLLKKKERKREKASKKPSKQRLDIRDCASVTRPPLTPGCSVPPPFLHTEAGKHLNPDVAASQHARSFWYQPPVVLEEKKSCTQGEWTRQQVNDQTKTNHVVYQHRPTNDFVTTSRNEDSQGNESESELRQVNYCKRFKKLCAVVVFFKTWLPYSDQSTCSLYTCIDLNALDTKGQSELGLPPPSCTVQSIFEEDATSSALEENTNEGFRFNNDVTSVGSAFVPCSDRGRCAICRVRHRSYLTTQTLSASVHPQKRQARHSSSSSTPTGVKSDDRM